MPEKRYKAQVEVTIRMPAELHKRAKRLVRKLEDAGKKVYTPHSDELVKPSLSVLALRGIEREVDLWEKDKS
jgi:hypothetical protein